MKWSRISYFILAIFPFLFMEAMGKIPGTDPVVKPGPDMEEYALCQEDSLVTEDKSSLARTSRESPQSIKGNVSLLSFNFIYYVIYKFMYVEDIFGLNHRPANAPN